MAVNVKAYLVVDGKNQEIRRFSIQGSDWDYLVQKLKEFFPRLCEENFTVFWKDEDEELVVVSSDEELAVAVENSGSELLKIYIRTGQDDSHTSENVEQPKEENSAMCVSCFTTINGLGFRCTTCPDYELCASCESQGIHGEHDMIRVHLPEISDCFGMFFGPTRGHPFRGRGFGRGIGKRGRNGKRGACGGRGAFAGVRSGFGPGFGFEMPLHHPPHHPPHPHHQHHPLNPIFNASVKIGGFPFGDFAAECAPNQTQENVSTDNSMEAEQQSEDDLNRCISQMEAMGFRDDGGWLSSLIREKNYDIDKVLEAIHPEGK